MGKMLKKKKQPERAKAEVFLTSVFITEVSY